MLLLQLHKIRKKNEKNTIMSQVKFVKSIKTKNYHYHFFLLIMETPGFFRKSLLSQIVAPTSVISSIPHLHELIALINYIRDQEKVRRPNGGH